MNADLSIYKPTISDGFQFSQSSLQDFKDCRRRFQLGYIQEVAWPALQSEPAMENELGLQKGARFHHLVYQHLLGVPPQQLSNSIHDEDLRRWWDNYIEYVEHLSSAQNTIYPEFTLTAPLGNYRLLAKYDLLVIEPTGECTIIDWKTSRRRPRRTWLAERLQTRIYPYLLVRGGSRLACVPSLPPEQVKMVYWFTEFPDQPESFVYDQAQYQADRKYLEDLLTELERRAQVGDFPLTQDERQCAYCVYRSLCERGTRAGLLTEMDADIESQRDMEIDLNFEQVVEIEF